MSLTHQGRRTSLVLATRNSEFYNDRVFDAGAIRHMRPSLQPMATPWLAVHAEAVRRGIDVVTADRVTHPRATTLIAYDWTPDAQRLVDGGARPGALVSFEPPVIAWRLYVDLPRLSGIFPDIFLFEGARARVRSSFHSLRFPQPCPAPSVPGAPWVHRRFMVMINSNKALPKPTSVARWFDRPRELSVKRVFAAVRFAPIRRDRYDARLAAIDAFGELDDFDLYGEGWQRRHPAVSTRQHARAMRAYRGPVEDKLRVLTRYQFALAIENTRFPGYISEKLFDCLFAGTIPVYDGAPDALRDIPRDVFIDVSRFSRFSELEGFLRAVTATEAQRYVEAGRAFLTSPAYERFCAHTFARELLDALQ
jgi:hypothetical protein